MKILTWNCNGAFRKKFENLLDFRADIYIIQECEDPEQTQHKAYRKWAQNYLWVGSSKNRGLGIFAGEHIKLQPLDWSNTFIDHTVRHFLPCLVNDDFQLIGVWAHQNDSPTFGYIGQVWKYLQVNKPRLQKALLAGDFNSNKIWDQWDRWWNHSDVVKELSELGIESLYHKHHQEEQGQESIPTFYFNRKHDRPYHIDYMFGSSEFLSTLVKLEISKKEEWLQVSDHLPIFGEFA
ncbi:endonuclease/exonuclease/phosphatase family protein [uncultured Pontibacter sp.]|uniref:endonuclease/exonuclease/phosphatase family protein n=1 Tax=uncultured Pontibacter sp. TaxID=453356 RepID=UPI00262DD280|nr:endonuclease/exonuclease/phosphatase family protein [uncultured Pontibacter sp.]